MNRPIYRSILALSLLLCACGDDLPELSTLGKLLDGNVFAYSQDHSSDDALQTMRGTAKKMLVYFENTSSGMRYLKVAMDLSTLGFNAYAGEASFDGDRITLQDKHLCHYSEHTSTELRGDTIETIFSQMSGCAAPSNAPQQYALKSETVRGSEVVFDPSGAVTWTRLYSNPGGVDAATRALLGAYQLTGSYYCSAFTPATYLSLFATPSGELRYIWLQESVPFSGYNVEEGKFAAAGGSLSFTPEYLGACSSQSYLYPIEAPVFPLNLRTSGCQAAQLPQPYNMGYATADAQCTLFIRELTLTGPNGSYPYMKGALEYPATSGTGAHYIWSVLFGT